jgi:hypothetical protein
VLELVGTEPAVGEDKYMPWIEDPSSLLQSVILAHRMSGFWKLVRP